MTDEELIARLYYPWPKDGDPEEVTLTVWLELTAKAADRIEALEAKLATCEKYRDAYAECDRIGTQAVRDLEAKLEKAVAALRGWIEFANEKGIPVSLSDLEAADLAMIPKDGGP